MTNTPLSTAPTVSFFEALRFWLKLGFISFGGPAGQIAIMQRELVDERRWISQSRFNHALNYCMVLPGPEAQQLATYIGWLMHRTWGGIVAGALFVLPSLFILIALSWLYVRYGTLPSVASLLWGVQCAVAAIVLQALWRVFSRTLPKPKDAPILIALAALSFIAMSVFKVSFLWIVAIAALVGYWGAKKYPSQFAGGGHGSATKTKTGTYVIDDETPTPAHAVFSKNAMLRCLVIGMAIWAAAFFAIVFAFGWNHTLTHMAQFFTQAALVTFGGAYAVLPYVAQTAVEQYHWLRPEQMMAGLALGETTPGPLIMIVAFVGFLGGWSQQVLGSNALFLGAACAATVATFFTFLPSFIFILAGGPFIESTHGKLGFTAPLKAISAAVIGAIASLAWLFISHTAWSTKGIDFFAIGLMLLAALLLFKANWGIIKVIALCAALGLFRSFLN